MALKDLIYKNIVLQIKNNIQLADCQKELNRLQQEASANTGGMKVLAELYKEETGDDLQRAINADPEFADMIKRAESEARGGPSLVSKQLRAVEADIPQQDPVPAIAPLAPQTPKLRKSSDNMKIEAPQQKDSAPQQKERTRAPVQVVIDDDPPMPGHHLEDD